MVPEQMAISRAHCGLKAEHKQRAHPSKAHPSNKHYESNYGRKVTSIQQEVQPQLVIHLSIGIFRLTNEKPVSRSCYIKIYTLSSSAYEG